MAEFPSLPLWTDAYIADTQHLKNEEHGVYLRLLMFAWRTPDCALPNDDSRLAIMVGVTPKKWAALKPIIMSFWDLGDTGWTQKKLTSERGFVERSRKQKSTAGIASARAKALKNNKLASTAVATDMPTETQRECQQPIPIPTSSKKKEAKASPKKGTRIPDDWTVPLNWIDWSISQGLLKPQACNEAAKFHDYWLARPGQGGVKLDWSATWRNWVRNALERQQQGNSNVRAFGERSKAFDLGAVATELEEAFSGFESSDGRSCGSDGGPVSEGEAEARGDKSDITAFA